MRRRTKLKGTLYYIVFL